MTISDARLLLVEDEPDLRDALGEYFEAYGFHVRAAATAAEALTLAQVELPDVVLCDLSLPDRRGDAFLTDYHQRFPTSLLYVHSGDSTFVPPATLVACGVTKTHVFAKPADLGAMVTQFTADLALL